MIGDSNNYDNRVHMIKLIVCTVQSTVQSLYFLILKRGCCSFDLPFLTSRYIMSFPPDMDAIDPDFRLTPLPLACMCTCVCVCVCVYVCECVCVCMCV